MKNMKQEKLKLYYWGHPVIRNVYNFGDLISPLLVRHYCEDDLIENSDSASNGDIFSTGSIIEHIPQNKYAIILGSGLIKEGERRLPEVRYYAVRGELTKAALGITEDIALGDPALLLPRVLPHAGMREKVVGIVPHFQHYSHPDLDSFRNNPDYKVINVRAEPEYVIKEICSCSCIVSSSLHGLIVADAYGIPNIRLAIGHTLYGGDFKFEDYYSAIGRTGEATRIITPAEISPSLTICTDYMSNIPAVQDKLERAFRQFAADIPTLLDEKRAADNNLAQARQVTPSPYRIDIKCLSGLTELRESSVGATQPAWLSNESGVGWLLQGRAAENKSILLQLEVLKDSRISLRFRGPDKQINGKRVPVYTFYNQIAINGKNLLHMPIVTWHDKPYVYECTYPEGSIISVMIEMLPVEIIE